VSTTFGLTLRRLRAQTQRPATLEEQRHERRHVWAVSQSRLAALCDFDHSYVSRLEAGQRHPTRAAVERIATALQLDDDDRRELYHAAGFLRDDDLAHRPDLIELDRRLANPEIPGWVRSHVERQIAELTRLLDLTVDEKASAA
jgi:transcriptional regulator with XRE-family HTH domain